MVYYSALFLQMWTSVRWVQIVAISFVSMLLDHIIVIVKKDMLSTVMGGHVEFLVEGTILAVMVASILQAGLPLTRLISIASGTLTQQQLPPISSYL